MLLLIFLLSSSLIIYFLNKNPVSLKIKASLKYLFLSSVAMFQSEILDLVSISTILMSIAFLLYTEDPPNSNQGEFLQQKLLKI